MILNRSSAESLRSETAENLEPGQDTDWMIEQFRGNIVIDGLKPYEENDWLRIEIGGSLSLEISGLCTRCNIIGNMP